ncbi:MAG: peptidylprolyl isomerase [Myxococcales bacterium]
MDLFRTYAPPLLAASALILLAGCKDEPPSSTPASTSRAASSAQPAQTAQTAVAPPVNPALLDPSRATEQAPEVYKARFVTNRGEFTIEVHRDWAPVGADRFFNLVKLGYYDDTRFFRIVDGFMVQWGIHGDPAVSARWRDARVSDDPVKQQNKRGFVTFATSGKDSRTTQIFINYVDDNVRLDGMGFAPFGKVIEGMNVVDGFNKAYGERPNQGRIQGEGNAYLQQAFPEMDWVKSARIVTK